MPLGLAGSSDGESDSMGFSDSDGVAELVVSSEAEVEEVSSLPQAARLIEAVSVSAARPRDTRPPGRR